jgi:hypothetical protein
MVITYFISKIHFKIFKNIYSHSYKSWNDIPYTFKQQIYQDSTIAVCSFTWTHCRDHAGIDIKLGLVSYCVHFNFYDNRHWNSKSNAWNKQ